MRKVLLVGILLWCSNQLSYSQQTLVSGVPYTQNFDVLGSAGAPWTDNATIVSWYAAYGSSTLSTYNASTGSSSTGSLYSLGASAATERSLGSLNSGTTGAIFYGVRLKNNTASEMQSLTVSFTGEQWRYIKDASAQTLSFSYRVSATAITSLITGTWTDVPELNFTSPNIGSASTGAIDGNAVSNRISLSKTFNVSIPAGSEIMLKFTDTDDSGSDIALGIDDFSVTSFTTLPISLTSFTAKAIDKSILLNWKTASEKDNQKFEVLRSTEDKNFRPIGTIAGSGNSDTEISYSFVDENPYAGINYYQLKQIDNNGASTLSNVISAISKIEAVKITAFASNSSVTANISSPNQTEAEITLFNLGGTNLGSKSIILNKGFNEVIFNQPLMPGVYFFNLVIAGKSTNLKFIN